MRVFLFALILVSSAANAQPAILMDRNFQRTIQVVDSVTMEQVSNGLMPLYIEDIDTVLKAVEWLMNYVDNGRPEIKGMLDFNAGRSRWTARTDKYGMRKLYTIVLNTGFGTFETYMVVAANEPNKRAFQRLSMFADYLRNNRAQISDLTSIVP